MPTVIWTTEDCQACLNAKRIFKDAEISYTEIAVERLTSGELPNIDAMAALADQNMAVPLVSVNGKFVTPDALQTYLERRGNL